jgi:uncharacterized membrane protein HdeD (DUF308 family)
MVNGPPWLLIAKDVILFSVGIFGIMFQLLTGEVNALLLGVFTSILGIPAVTNIFSLLKQAGESPPPPSPSEPSSESPTSPSGTR